MTIKEDTTNISDSIKLWKANPNRKILIDYDEISKYEMYEIYLNLRHYFPEIRIRIINNCLEWDGNKDTSPSVGAAQNLMDSTLEKTPYVSEDRLPAEYFNRINRAQWV